MNFPKWIIKDIFKGIVIILGVIVGSIIAMYLAMAHPVLSKTIAICALSIAGLYFVYLILANLWQLVKRKK